jgi:DNA-binding transcriptional LysR family regulator
MLTSVNGKIVLSDLEAALVVAEKGHFTRAGEILHRSQTAVTKGLQRLERAIDAQLVDRRTRPSSTTEAGDEFSYHVRKGLYYIELGLMGARAAGRIANTVLEVGHTTYFNLDLLTYLANVSKAPTAGFNALYHSSSSAEVVARVLAGLWDCGFIVCPAETGGLETIPVMEDRLGLIMAKDHPLTRKRSVVLRDLRQQRLILPGRDRNPGFRNWFLERCGAAGFGPEVVQESSHPQEGAFLASQHVGLAVTARSASTQMQKGLAAFRPLQGEGLSIEFHLAYRAGSRSSALQSFIEAVLRMKTRMHNHLKPKSPSQTIDSREVALKRA